MTVEMISVGTEILLGNIVIPTPRIWRKNARCLDYPAITRAW